MKTTLLFVLLSFVSSVSAQTDFRFADSTAQWNILTASTYPPGPLHVETYQIIKDTVITGKQYQQITAPFGNRFLRQDSLKVFIKSYYDSPEKLLYDFSKKAGDTVTISFPAYVDSVDTIYLDRPRIRMYVKYSRQTPGNFSDVWIEGIGAMNSYFLYPGQSKLCPDCGTYTTICLYENGLEVYRNEKYNCDGDMITGIEPVKESTLRLSPNPAHNNVRVAMDNIKTVEIFDATGRQKLIANTGLATDYNFSVEGWSAGIYLVTATGANGQQVHSTLVVE